jgi:DnaJ-class molecular chaperone
LLGLQRGADEAAIKAAYRRLAKECHPDRHNGCPDKEARFKAVNEAYDVLKDPQKRAAYDRFGKAAFHNGGNGDPFGEAGFTGFIRHLPRPFSASSWTRASDPERRSRRRPALRSPADPGRSIRRR